MENSRLYALRVFHHDPHRSQHIVAHDEGMYHRRFTSRIINVRSTTNHNLFNYYKDMLTLSTNTFFKSDHTKYINKRSTKCEK